MLSPETPYVIVTIVTPETDDPATSGRVINLPCAPTISHDMLERTGEKTWGLRLAWVERGYSMINALYQHEANLEHATDWAKYVADGQAGKRVGVFPREKLPKEVIRRQACGELDEVKALADAKRTAPVTGKVSK